MSHVFISYASPDREKAKSLASLLVARGHTVFWDRKIPPGKTWEEVIEAALDNARAVVVLWSKAAVKSDWVRAEASDAAGKKILVPALLEPTELPVRFRAIQTADLSDWDGVTPSAELDGLIGAVDDLVGNARSVEQAVDEPRANDSEPPTPVAGRASGQRIPRRQVLIATSGIGVSAAAGWGLFRHFVYADGSGLHVRRPRYVHRARRLEALPSGPTPERRAIDLANAGARQEALNVLSSAISYEIRLRVGDQERGFRPVSPLNIRLWDLYAIIAMGPPEIPGAMAELTEIGRAALTFYDLPLDSTHKRTRENIESRLGKWSAPDSTWRRERSTPRQQRIWGGLLM